MICTISGCVNEKVEGWSVCHPCHKKLVLIATALVIPVYLIVVGNVFSFTRVTIVENKETITDRGISNVFDPQPNTQQLLKSGRLKIAARNV